MRKPRSNKTNKKGSTPTVEPVFLDAGDRPIVQPVDVEILPPEELEHPEVEPAVIEVVEPEIKQRKAASAPVPYDTLSAYLREISQFPQLSREDEKELALRFLKTKDREAAYRLISSNLMLVVKIARDYEKAARSILDLIQEGNIGLMEAVQNFDPYKEVRFPSYAIWWIKAYIIRYIIANWRMVKIGTTQAQRKLFFNLKKERDKLEREGFFPAPKLLAEKLNVKESEVIEMEQRLSAPDMSVDAPLHEDSDSSLLSVLPARGASAEQLLATKQSRQLLQTSIEQFMQGLKENERAIFTQRMLAEDKATLQDLSDQLALSRERVRQIENRLREKFKDFLQSKFGNTLEGIEFKGE